MSPEEEAAIRADERLKVLRKVRGIAIRMDRDPANDPYLWGYGGREIAHMLTREVQSAREAQEALTRVVS